MSKSDLPVLGPYRHSAWAVLPQTLEAMVRARHGELTADAIKRQLEVAAATDLAASTSGIDVPTTGGVAVIPLQGLITAKPSLLSLLFGGGGGLKMFRTWFRAALASDDVGSILLDVNSPGGSTDLVEETAKEIREARGTKPITAIANTHAASAAYYIAAQADELVVTPSGEVGSIGVFMLHWDESGLNEQMGIDPTYISAGKFKVEGNPDSPLDATAKAALQQTVDDYYELFVGAVADGRGVSADAVRKGFGEGRMVTAQRAVGAQLADRVATFEETVALMAGSDRPSPDASAVNVNTKRAMGALRLARPRHL
jgi:signal peptide peptidase SppA